MKFEVVVIGAGINGLATAYWLQKFGVKSIAILEQYEIGHSRGSSQGFSRITRSTYSTPKYVEIMQQVHQLGWPQWEKDLGEQLLFPRSGCFFGPGLEPYLQSLQAVPEVLPYIDVVSAAEGRKLFPHFSFPDSPQVIRDRTCSLIGAQATCQALRRHFVAQGGQLLENTKVHTIFTGQAALGSNNPRATFPEWIGDSPVGYPPVSEGTTLRLATAKGHIYCGKLVVTAGPWCGQLVSDRQGQLKPAHQDVGYFQFGSPSPPYGLDNFPVWVYAGEGGLAGDDTFYGLPEYHRPGVKVARHRTGSHQDDPDRAVSQHMPPKSLEDLMAFNQQQFAFPTTLSGYEPCMYTNTPNEDFLLDLHPGNPNIVIGAGFSGHGFKLAPFTGQVLAELLLSGKTSLACFEKYRQDFSVPGLPYW